MCKTWISKIPENGFDVRPLTIFKPKPTLGCIRKMSREPQIMTIFVSTLFDKYSQNYGNFDIWPNFLPSDIIDVLSS